MKVIENMLAVLTIIAAVGNGAAQTITSDDVLINGDNGTVNLKVTGNNGVLFTGTLGSGTHPGTGFGVGMMWYPKKAAFRVGEPFGGEWDDEYIGNYSFGAGYASFATGEHSAAIGYSAGSIGSHSIALGRYALAGQEGSCALGDNCAADGFRSVAIGYGGYSQGEMAMALGASGAYADYSFAIGVSNATYGDYSMAIGSALEAISFRSVVVGYQNVPDYDGNPEAWSPSDSLLILGNGNGGASNALVVRKDALLRTGGAIEAKKGMRTKPLGDLSMGAFTAGANPDTLDQGLEYPSE